LSKIKCFLCHKNGHDASQFLEKNKGKGKKQQKKVATFTETQMNEFKGGAHKIIFWVVFGLYLGSFWPMVFILL
jgi:hypothetical protein